MPTFQITAPDGKKYRVQGENAEGAMAAVRKMAGAPAPVPAPAPAGEAMPEPPPGMELDPVTGQLFDPGLRQAGIDRHRQDPVVGALQRTGRVADDFVRGAADIASFGTADEIAAKLSPGDYDANLAAERERDANGGAARVAGQVGGAVLVPGAAAKTFGGAALQGIVQGGLYGFGSGEDGAAQRAENAAYGAAAGGVAGGAVHGIASSLGNRAARAAVPSTAEIKATSKAGYAAADASGVIVKPEGVQHLSSDIKESLTDFGYLPALHPRVGAVLNEMDRLAEGNLTFKSLQLLRRVAGNAAKSADSSEAEIGRQMVQKIDGYMEALPADDVLTGNAGQAAAGVRQGNENWARFRRSEMVDTQAVKAARRAASTGTGGNADNVMRQNVRAILDNPKRSRGMTADELKAADRVVMGSKAENNLRRVGRLSPATGGLSTLLTTGATMLNPVLGIPAVIGAGAKALADRSTMRNVQELSEIIRSGGYKASEIAKAAQSGAGPKELVQAIERYRRGERIAAPAASVLGAAVAERVRR